MRHKNKSRCFFFFLEDLFKSITVETANGVIFSSSLVLKLKKIFSPLLGDPKKKKKKKSEVEVN